MSKDIIYRKDAIAVINKWFGKIGLNPDILIDGIISMPTVTTKYIHYFDEDEKLWRTGEVIVDE